MSDPIHFMIRVVTLVCGIYACAYAVHLDGTQFGLSFVGGIFLGMFVVAGEVR